MKIKLYNWLAKDLGKLGREGDTELAHVNPFEQKLLKAVGGSGTINPITNLKEFKGGGGQSQQSSNEIDPMLKPYISYGLDEAKTLYNNGAPSYYGGNTYLNPNAQQQQAIDMMTANAGVNNQMLQNSTDLNNSMIKGDYLQNNPNFNAVMETAGRAATDQYNNAMQGTNSQASMSGRYGSDAHARMASNNSSNLAQSLADTAGQYAYQNYANERGNQINAMNNAGTIANNQNVGANNLMQAGGYQAQFDQAALDADIARHDYGQNSQQMHLNNYLTAAYGAPGGSQTTTTSSGGGK